MHHEINTIIQHEGRNFKVTQSGKYAVIDGCAHCGLYKGKDEPCGWDYEIFGQCDYIFRDDQRNVHFVEVTEEGQPIPEPCYLTFSDDDMKY